MDQNLKKTRFHQSQGCRGQKSVGKQKLKICAPRPKSKKNSEASLFCNPKRLDYRFHCKRAIIVSLRGLTDFSQRCSDLKWSFDPITVLLTIKYHHQYSKNNSIVIIENFQNIKNLRDLQLSTVAPKDHKRF